MKRPASVKAECIQRAGDMSDEVTKETLDFGNAIMAGCEEVFNARQAANQIIDMRALLGALVSVMAHYIAGIPDQEQRMLAFGRCGEELNDMINTNVDLGTHANAYNPKDFVQ